MSEPSKMIERTGTACSAVARSFAAAYKAIQPASKSRYPWEVVWYYAACLILVGVEAITLLFVLAVGVLLAMGSALLLTYRAARRRDPSRSSDPPVAGHHRVAPSPTPPSTPASPPATGTPPAEVTQTDGRRGTDFAGPIEVLPKPTVERQGGPATGADSVTLVDLRSAAIAALARSLMAVHPGVQLDADGRVAALRDNLVSGVTALRLAVIEKQLRAGDGAELAETPVRKPKLHAPHSSSALVVNTFGPWLGEEGSLPLAGHVGFAAFAFEEKVPTGLRGKPPNLDVIARRGSEIVAIESKCTSISPAHAHHSRQPTTA
jgi:hypothetical protein